MKDSEQKVRKKKFEMPSSICILIILTIVLAILTHLIPAGEYTRVDNVPVAGTYMQVESNPQGIWDILAAPMQGFRGAIDIILFVFVLSGCLGIIGKSRSLDAGLMYVINRLNGREKLMIPIVMFIASIGGTTFGFSEETIPFYPILIPMFIAMGYDAVTACMVLFLGSGAGIVGALINPFSVGIGSDIAGISLADGMLIRVVIYIATVTASILFTMHYAEKVRKDPTKSVVYDIRDEIESHIHKLGTDDIPEFTRQRKAILTVFASSFIVMILAIIPWSSKFNIYVFDNIHENLCQIPLVGRLIGNMQPLGGWGMKELTVIFLLAAVIIGKMSHMKEKEMISLFVGGCQNILGVAITLGCAKGLSVIMTDGLIMDTILHFGEILMSGVSRVVFPALAYIVYIFLSFFIPSSSGLATATIPIIGSLGEFLGVGKEFAVMVCAAGSETMNLISPTQAVLMGALAIAGVPFPRWVKAVLPFFFIVIAIVSTIVTIAVLL